MSNSKAFLGKGFSFPPRVNPVTGHFVMEENEEDIRQAVMTIIRTRKGERAMLPDFGCDIYQYIYELPDASYEYSICDTVRQALTDWEPRIIHVQVELDQKDLKNGKIYLQISYQVRATNNPNNLVFPFYLEEGVGEE